jgi:hypothetical protein
MFGSLGAQASVSGRDHTSSMACYQCMFLNHADDVFGSDFLSADTDEVAVDHALTIYRNGIGKGFELWRGDKLIYAHIHGQRA